MKRVVVIPGHPVAKGRPRCGRSPTGKIMAYTPKETTQAEQIVALSWKAQHGLDPLTGPLRVTLTFLEGTGHKAQDVDNLAKLVLDALNRIAWEDDRQVEALQAEVFRNRAEPQTRILVEEMEHP